MTTTDITNDNTDTTADTPADSGGPSMLTYRYGCLPPLSGLAEMEKQTQLAHSYQNLLVEFERARRRAQRAHIYETATGALRDILDREAAAERAVDAAWEKVQMLRSGRGDKKASIEAQDAAADEARALGESLRAIWKEGKELRAAAWKEAKSALREIGDRANAMARLARAAYVERGLWWGTYLVVEDAIAQAARDPIHDPNFHRWGESRETVGIHIQGYTLRTEEVVGGNDRFFQIDPTPWDKPRRDPNRKRQERKHPSRARIAKFRVNSTGPGGRVPVWIEIPVIFHRPLPAGTVQWVRLSRTKIGTEFKYELFVVVKLDEGARSAPQARAGGVEVRRIPGSAIAIDVGWRAMPRVPGSKDARGSLRVAAWADTEGNVGELRLPTILDEMAQVESIRGIRDERCNELRKILEYHLVTFARSHGVAPAWLKESAARWSGWHQPERWVQCLRRWVGDVPGYAPGPFVDEIRKTLEGFAKKERHLHDWEDNQRQQILDQRRAKYRQWAAEISSRYEMVLVEEMDLRDFAQKELDEKWWARVQRYQQRAAAPSELREALKHACARRGAIYGPRAAAYTTKDCAEPGPDGVACGSRETWNAAMELIHTCSKCGTKWDQDLNAARNLLLRGVVRSGEPGSAEKAKAKKKLQSRRNRKAPKKTEPSVEV